MQVVFEVGRTWQRAAYSHDFIIVFHIVGLLLVMALGLG